MNINVDCVDCKYFNKITKENEIYYDCFHSSNVTNNGKILINSKIKNRRKDCGDFKKTPFSFLRKI